MRVRSVRIGLIAIVAVVGLSAALAQLKPVPVKLVLVLAIDQMRFDYLTRFAPLYTGGLKTLLERGAVFTNARYRHSATETGPGHSVILSGRHPRHSGIVANDWYDPYQRKFVNVVDDPVQGTLGGPGRSASPANALSFTVGDVLKATRPQSVVVGVSQKDRSAILMGGRRADAAYWYEAAGGNFITSTYYMREPPAWLTAWNNRHVADAFAGQMWQRLLPDASVYDEYAGPDNIHGEWDRKDTVFPHAIRGRPPERLFYDDLRRTPFSDQMTLEFALEAMKAHRIGEDENPDVFAIGFASTDVVGHTYGSDSHETMDQLLRLDLLLGKLFSEIDARVGPGSALVVLTADHGALPLVENLASKGIEARRAAPAMLQTAVKRALDERFGVIDGLFVFSPPDFYFVEETLRRHRIARKDAEATAIAALQRTELVEKVYTHNDLTDTSPSSDPFLPLFRNAFYPPRSPHLNVLLKKHVYLSSAVGGSGHGTAHDYDRHVPLIFMGAGVRPGSYGESSGPEDIAPTLAWMLGLEFPRENDARVLMEIAR